MKIDIRSKIDGYSFSITDLHCSDWKDVEYLIKSLEKISQWAEGEEVRP